MKKYAKRAIALVLSFVLAFGGSVMTAFAAVDDDPDPNITGVTANVSELSSEGGEVEVTVEGNAALNALTTLYYRLQTYDNESGYWMSVGMGERTPVGFSDGKIKVNLPANSEGTDIEYRIQVNYTDSPNGMKSTGSIIVKAQGTSGGDTPSDVPVLSDANTFRAKVVDTEGNPLSGVAFSVEFQGYGGTSEYSIVSDNSGILIHELNEQDADWGEYTISLADSSYEYTKEQQTVIGYVNDDYSFETEDDGSIPEDECEDELVFVLNRLGNVVNKDALKAAITEANTKASQVSVYTAESIAALKTVIEEAESCWSSGSATQEEVDAQTAKLNQAIADLEVKPSITSATANRTGLTSEGGEVEVAVEGTNLPAEKLYYKIQKMEGLNIWTDLEDETGAVKEAVFSNGVIKVVLPANETKEDIVYRAAVGYTSEMAGEKRTANILVEAAKSGDTQVISDETTFRAKVVDEDGNLLDGIQFEMDYDDGLGKTPASTASSNGVFEYKPSKYFDKNTTIIFSVVADQKASDTEKWVCTETYTITTNSSAQITRVGGVELAQAQEITFTLKKEEIGDTPEPAPSVTELDIAVKDTEGNAVSGVSFKAVDVDFPLSTPKKYTSDYDGVLNFVPELSYSTYALQLDDDSEYISNPDIIYITVNGKKEITEIKIGDNTYDATKECEFVLTKKGGEEPIQPGNKTISFKVVDGEGNAVNGVYFDIVEVGSSESYPRLMSTGGAVVFVPSAWNEEVSYEIKLAADSEYTSSPVKFTVKVNEQNEIAEVDGVVYNPENEYKFVLTPTESAVDASTIKVRVLDNEGKAVSNVKFNLIDESMDYETVATIASAENGMIEYSVDKLVSGTYRLQLASEEKATWKCVPTTGVSYIVGENGITKINNVAFTGEEDITLTLYPNDVPIPEDPLKTIKVEIVDKDGKAVNGVNFRVVEEAFASNPTGGEKKVSENGAISYKVTSGGETTYVIKLTDDTYTSSPEEIVFKTNAQNQITEVQGTAYTGTEIFRFELTSKSGGDDPDPDKPVHCDANTFRAKVVDSEGNPISGITFNYKAEGWMNASTAGKTNSEGIIEYKFDELDKNLTLTFTVKKNQTAPTGQTWVCEDKHVVITDADSKIVSVDGVAIADVEEIVYKLTKAGEATKADKAALEKAIAYAEALDASKYTEESFAKVAEELVKADALNKKADATQEEVDAQVKALNDAVDNLKEKEAKLPFTDIPNEWYQDAIKYVFEKGLMTGKDTDTFAPDENLARAQFAVILHRMNGTPEMKYEAKFPDVKEDVWYTDAILWASEQKIVTGYTNTGCFGPADNINREQMATMMYRYAKSKGYDVSNKTDFSKYADAGKVSAYADEAMQWAVGNGIITGKNNGTVLDPQGNATRAECATIMMRFMEKYN